MPARNRSRNVSLCGGGKTTFYQWSGGQWVGPHNGLTGFTGVSGFESMSDATGPKPWPDRNLSLTRYEVEPLRISGIYEKSWKEVWDNYNPTNRSQYTYCPTVTPNDNDYWVTKALANLNPNKPIVDLPVFLFELREFPRMLMQLGRALKTLGSDVVPRSTKKLTGTDYAGAYLAYSFGWAPLVGDLLKLLKLEEAISRRVNYLSKHSNGGGKVKRTLGTVDIPRGGGSYSLSWLNSPPSVKGSYTIRERKRIWFVSNMQILDTLPKDNPEMRRVARNAALGLNLSAATLWEALPWSWLIDYFANIGDILEASRGGIRFKASNLNLMIESEVENVLGGWDNQGTIKCSGGTLRTIHKSRSVHPIPLPRLAVRPFWTEHMKGILASLALVTALSGGKPGKVPGIR
jgi:hypothetical protein